MSGGEVAGSRNPSKKHCVSCGEPIQGVHLVWFSFLTIVDPAHVATTVFAYWPKARAAMSCMLVWFHDPDVQSHAMSTKKRLYEQLRDLIQLHGEAGTRGRQTKTLEQNHTATDSNRFDSKTCAMPVEPEFLHALDGVLSWWTHHEIHEAPAD